MKPRAVYYEVLAYRPRSLEIIKNEFNLTILESPDQDTDNILSTVEVLFAPMGYFVGAKKIGACPNLRVIATSTTGVPHIDVNYATKNNIEVLSLKGETEFLHGITPTAELTWGLIVAITRNIVPAIDAVRNGIWDRRQHGGDQMLSRMSLGIVGYGRLGSMVGQYGRCFGMDVMYYDPYVTVSDPHISRIDSLEALVSRSDVITLHIPHEQSTERLFDGELFARFKKGSYLVNTSRGEVVDHRSLLLALETGRLAGAACDVFPNEFNPQFSLLEDPLWSYFRNNNNLILTPHIGGSTIDAWEETQIHTIKNVLSFLKKQIVEDGR